MSSPISETPYSPPREAEMEQDPPPLLDPLTRHARYGWKLGLPAMLALPLALLVSAADLHSPAWGILPAFAVALALAGALWGLGTALGFALHRGPRPPGLWTALGAIPFNLVGAYLSLHSIFIVADRFVRGRQLRDRQGRLLFAELEEDSGWLGPRDSHTPSNPQTRTAAAWRDNGLTEHASVVAFARLAQNLVELGAPMSLVESAHQDALDELRHTRLCFDLARELDGRALGPGAFPGARRAAPNEGSRAERLAALAAEALVDGALNEGVSARVVAELSWIAEEPARRVLLEIARDESRHAAHAFHLMRWCLEAGGPEVAETLLVELEDIPSRPARPTLGAHEDERLGIPSQARIDRAYIEVRARLQVRVRRLLADWAQAEVPSAPRSAPVSPRQPATPSSPSLP